jgi:hypothetical protein
VAGNVAPGYDVAAQPRIRARASSANKLGGGSGGGGGSGLQVHYEQRTGRRVTYVQVHYAQTVRGGA